MDTIFAPATAPGRSGIAVVRISGPLAFDVCRSLTGDVPKPRQASLQKIIWKGDIIDEALVLTFHSGASFTGEDTVEFQLHGSPAIMASMLRILGEFDGLRSAEAGEFTRRALENERLDLAQVEGLADLIDAETEVQRRQAMNVFGGALGKKVAFWRANALRAAALIEATIDFADEDIPEDVVPEVRGLLADLIVDFRQEAKGVRAAERIREGLEIAIVGPPNSGKSTLLNRLAGREAAITSEIAGTTRDVIEVRMDIGGLPVTLLDTAGLRETDDVVEAIGVDRARERSRAADLRIFMGDPGPEAARTDRDILVAPKADLDAEGAGLPVSGLTGQGIDALLAKISEGLAGLSTGSVTATRFRHLEALQKAADALEEAQFQLNEDSYDLELTAECIRIALRAIDGLVGRIGVEDVLGEIFSSFCIGK